ncbi:unnamed protein product [Coffea canephora]|uniref:Uncharacterized protein n=1 Tax=Coffea canephora TaxID=49390 RepID=A0A068UUP0_COFCA|nr:unnamed protein product [Coffea canephora]
MAPSKSASIKALADGQTRTHPSIASSALHIDLIPTIIQYTKMGPSSAIKVIFFFHFILALAVPSLAASYAVTWTKTSLASPGTLLQLSNLHAGDTISKIPIIRVCFILVFFFFFFLLIREFTTAIRK